MRNRTLSVESLIDEGDWAEPGGWGRGLGLGTAGHEGAQGREPA